MRSVRRGQPRSKEAPTLHNLRNRNFCIVGVLHVGVEEKGWNRCLDNSVPNLCYSVKAANSWVDFQSWYSLTNQPRASASLSETLKSTWTSEPSAALLGYLPVNILDVSLVGVNCLLMVVEKSLLSLSIEPTARDLDAASLKRPASFFGPRSPISRSVTSNGTYDARRLMIGSKWSRARSSEPNFLYLT